MNEMSRWDALDYAIRCIEEKNEQADERALKVLRQMMAEQQPNREAVPVPLNMLTFAELRERAGRDVDVRHVPGRGYYWRHRDDGDSAWTKGPFNSVSAALIAAIREAGR